MILLDKKSNIIDRTDFYYSSSCQLLIKKTDIVPVIKNATIFGVCLGKTKISYNGSVLNLENEAYFSLIVEKKTNKFIIEPSEAGVVIFVRHGYLGLNQAGLNCEAMGRLTYIDGCTDTALVSPPRFGDPSLNLLSFPEKVNQSFHRHPTLRFGVVLDGAGIGDADNKSHALSKYSIFCIPENELHRFRTDKKPMRLIAFHPDGEFGPKDHSHAMLNRTYIEETRD